MTKPARSPITTHILDINKGRAASGIAVQLEKQEGGSWKELARGKTNADGRIEDLLPPGSQAHVGIYRLNFETKTEFYPTVSIVFEIKNPQEHYHVPLLLSPFGYSTYRGT